mgnify:CR=1 FL=1
MVVGARRLFIPFSGLLGFSSNSCVRSNLKALGRVMVRAMYCPRPQCPDHTLPSHVELPVGGVDGQQLVRGVSEGHGGEGLEGGGGLLHSGCVD